MDLRSSKEFPFSAETAWKALHQTSRLDVEPGTVIKDISDTEWETYNSETGSQTKYVAEFDDENRRVTIEGASNKKSNHDFIYLTLKEIAEERVELILEMEINTGTHFLAKALGAMIAKPAQEIISRHIYQNFEALCTGAGTRTMSSDDLKAEAAKVYKK